MKKLFKLLPVLILTSVASVNIITAMESSDPTDKLHHLKQELKKAQTTKEARNWLSRKILGSCLDNEVATA